jgi:hypothetical protein
MMMMMSMMQMMVMMMMIRDMMVMMMLKGPMTPMKPTTIKEQHCQTDDDTARPTMTLALTTRTGQP